MRLSDMKGRKQLRIVGMLMSLVDSISGESAFEDFLDAMRGDDDGLAMVTKLGPILEREDIADKLVEIVACAKGITTEEADECDVISELIELLTSDMELPAFLSERQ